MDACHLKLNDIVQINIWHHVDYDLFYFKFMYMALGIGPRLNLYIYDAKYYICILCC